MLKLLTLCCSCYRTEWPFGSSGRQRTEDRGQEAGSSGGYDKVGHEGSEVAEPDPSGLGAQSTRVPGYSGVSPASVGRTLSALKGGPIIRLPTGWVSYGARDWGWTTAAMCILYGHICVASMGLVTTRGIWGWTSVC